MRTSKSKAQFLDKLQVLRTVEADKEKRIDIYERWPDLAEEEGEDPYEDDLINQLNQPLND